MWVLSCSRRTTTASASCWKRSWAELPKEAKAYVEFLEKQLEHEIQFVSAGAEREKFVLKGEWL